MSPYSTTDINIMDTMQLGMNIMPLEIFLVHSNSPSHQTYKLVKWE